MLTAIFRGLPPLSAVFAVLLVLCAAPTTASPAITPSDRAALTRMVEHAKEKRWTSARDAARSTGKRAVLDAYEWLRLRQEGVDNFPRMTAWVSSHPGWPSQSRIQAQGERAIDKGRFSDAALLSFFERHPPVTGVGKVRFIEVLLRRGQQERARGLAREAWLEADLSRDDEQRLLHRFRETLAPLHDARLDALIWRTRLTAAERHLPRASRNGQALGRARITLLRGRGGVDGLVRAVPRQLLNDPGLAYARMYWRYKRGLRTGAIDLMLAQSKANALGRPEKWADERARFVRDAIEEGQHRLAYKLAAGHGMKRGAAYADLEWLAGWIALKGLNDPARARTHFERLHGTVSTPVSLARGAFWAGEAARAAGDNAIAEARYAQAADHPSAFYGQVALKRLAPGAALKLPAPVAAIPEACLSDPRLSVGSALAAGGALVEARAFFRDAALTCDSVGAAKALGLHAEALGAFRVSVALGRSLRRKSIFIPEITHPILRMPAEGCKGEKAPERGLSLAIARQESSFDPKARSGVGARGLMQVMPATGKRTARDAGLPYSLSRLSSERDYNARIGQCYLSKLLDRYDGAYALAIAAYNAGPSRVKKWLSEKGDPRTGEVDLIDWIERIPFKETRNYVQRVLESLEIYRARLKG